MALVPFSDRPTCPACQNDGMSYVDCTLAKRVVDCPVNDSDHLHMNCNRCSNTWLMAQKG